VKGGQLRPTDLVKKLGEPWRAASEISELSPHFAGPGGKTGEGKAESVPTRPASREELVSAKTQRLTSRLTERKITAVSQPRTEVRRPSATRPPPSESKPPASDSKPPASETKHPASETKTPPSDSKPPASDSKIDETPKARTRPVPKPPSRPRVRLEPMVGKYFSPVDLLRSASLAFEPRKLLLSAAMLVPLTTGCALLVGLSGDGESILQRMLLVLSLALLVFGFALALTTLGYVSRRQLEGEPYPVPEVIGYGVSNLATGILYPILVMIPSLLSLGVLWLLGFLRNSGATAASFLKYLYLLPMIFALLAVLGAFIYQLASMYVPAAAAAEGTGLTGSVQAAWLNMRRQWGRVVLHWLIVTVAFGVITAVCVGLAALAVALPNLVFGEARGEVAVAWSGLVSTPVFSVYAGIALGLGLALPASLFSTLGMLSYLSLRDPVMATLSMPPEETSHGGPGDSPRPALGAAEATHPASADSTAAGSPRSTSAMPKVADDSEDEPLDDSK
jgi:hypothetical protein